MHEVRNPQDQLIARYTYNSLHQRVSKTVLDGANSTTTHFLWSQGKLVAEMDAQGHITSQYLYLSEGQRATPFAKLESAQGAEHSYFIHADHRGAPLAMTDEDQHMVWQAEISPFGVMSTASSKNPNQQNQASLNLRLAGQYFDAETGLHDNWHRSYNPHTGRYLQPDPLGYPDGPDAYLYAQGDPVNKSDPMGLYQIDMHYYMTFFLGLAAGLDPTVARTIALAAQYIDDNPATKPVDDTNIWTTLFSATQNQTTLRYYHFMQDSLATGVDIHSIAKGNQLYNLNNAYINAPDCAQAEFFGGMLHALADTYSHADNQDVPYSGVNLAGLGVGHGMNDSDPDYTFSHWGYPATFNKLLPTSLFDLQPNPGKLWAVNWVTNSGRTLAAEGAMFDQFTNQTTWTKSGGRSFADIQAYLETFNGIGESEQYNFEWTATGQQARTPHTATDHGNVLSIKNSFGKKLDVLNAALKDMGINVDLTDPKWAYDPDLAAINRSKALFGLKCTDKTDAGKFKYAGTILPGQVCAQPLI